MAVQPNPPTKPKVIFAVYGGLKKGTSDNVWKTAKIVTDALQTAINNSPGEKVQINNGTMGGDPAHLIPKQFGAIVEINGVKRAFACPEKETIDFT